MSVSASDYVSAGEPFRPSASVWNEFVDAAKISSQQRLGRTGAGIPGAWGEPASLCRVKNTTGSAIPAHRAVKPTSVLSDLTEGREFTRHPVLVVGLPAAETDLVFVTLDPIPDGEIGRAAVMGMALVEVSVSNTSHLFAKPSASSPGLVSAPRGPIRLVIAPAATGTVKLPALLSNWWLIQVACSGGSIAVTY